MPLPEFNISTSLNLEGVADEKIALFRDAVVVRVNELDAELQARLQEAYSGGVVKQRTGKAARSVEAIPATIEGSMVVGRVTAGGGTAPYVDLLETGTAPHVITPKNASALAFNWNGQDVFFKRVNHPGTQAYHIVENTFEAMEDEIIASLQAIPEEVFG